MILSDTKGNLYFTRKGKILNFKLLNNRNLFFAACGTALFGVLGWFNHHIIAESTNLHGEVLITSLLWIISFFALSFGAESNIDKKSLTERQGLYYLRNIVVYSGLACLILVGVNSIPILQFNF